MAKPLRLFLALMFCVARAQAQNVEGQIIAAQYGQFLVPSQTTGSFSFPAATCQIAAAGKNFSAFATGVPIKIVDSNPNLNEIDTPSSVFNGGGVCSVNMSTTYVHNPPFYLTSGTGGLQEAITANQTNNGINTILLNYQWYQQVTPGNPATVIASVTGIASLGLVDVTTVPYTFYNWNGTQYVASAFGGGTTTHSLTFNASGAGAAPGLTFNGATAGTASYNTIGAQPLITWPTSGDLLLSNGTAAPGGLATGSNGNCAVVAGGVWTSSPCPGSTTVASVANSDGTLTIPNTTGNVTASLALGHPNTWTGLQTFGTQISVGGVTPTGVTGTGNFVLSASPTLSGTATVTNLTVTGTCSGCTGTGLVNSVTASDGSLTSFPTTGAVVVALNTGHANTYTALQTFGTNISIGGVTATGATGTGNNVFSISPALTGTPTAPTQAISTNNTDIATTAAVTTALGIYAPIASPTFTGTPAAPTLPITTNSTALATTAAVTTALAGYPLKVCSGSVTLSGTITSINTGSVGTGTCSGINSSTDVILISSRVNIFGVTGFLPTANGILTLSGSPGTNAVNINAENNTSGSITISGPSVNFMVLR